jgi:hypothetical protein
MWKHNLSAASFFAMRRRELLKSLRKNTIIKTGEQTGCTVSKDAEGRNLPAEKKMGISKTKSDNSFTLSSSSHSGGRGKMARPQALNRRLRLDM